MVKQNYFSDLYPTKVLNFSAKSFFVDIFIYIFLLFYFKYNFHKTHNM